MLFGIQGSGKGTQSKLLSEKFAMPIFETGAELRELAKSSSPLGQKVKSIIEAGNLVSDEIVMDVIKNFLRKIPAGQAVIFDGIPRSLSQQVLFDQLMEDSGRHPLAIQIDLSIEDALQRLSTRRLCSKCRTIYPASYEGEICAVPDCGGKLERRADDNVESIKRRLELYEKETLPVIENYANHHNVLKVDGRPSIPAVQAALLLALSQVL